MGERIQTDRQIDRHNEREKIIGNLFTIITNVHNYVSIGALDSVHNAIMQILNRARIV